MGEFAFEVRDALVLDVLDVEITLIGPVVDPGGGLFVGDEISVPLTDGDVSICECLGFPLVNLGSGRIDWVRVTVDGVAPGQVLIGGHAIRQR